MAFSTVKTKKGGMEELMARKPAAQPAPRDGFRPNAASAAAAALRSKASSIPKSPVRRAVGRVVKPAAGPVKRAVGRLPKSRTLSKAEQTKRASGRVLAPGMVYSKEAGGAVKDKQNRLPIAGDLTKAQMKKRFPKG